MLHHISQWFLARFGKAPSQQHRRARSYWQGCSDTFLANAEYYDQCEFELRERILPKIGKVDRVLDLGCGNGRFTLVLAKTAATVEAFDISPVLIAEALAAAEQAGVKTIRFQVSDIAHMRWPKSHYDVVSCMGVLSTLIDEWAFTKVVRNIRNSVRAGGFVILRESLSSLPDGQLTESDTYAIRYRNEDMYRKTMADVGMTLQYEAPLIRSGDLVNRIQLYSVGARS